MASKRFMWFSLPSVLRNVVLLTFFGATASGGGDAPRVSQTRGPVAESRAAEPVAQPVTAAEPAPAVTPAALPEASSVEADSCVQEMAGRIQSTYDGIRDLSGRFEQTTRAVSLGTSAALPAAPSTGRVTFSKPGRMRWAYEEPQPSLVVSDGSTLWLYDEAAGEAQRLAVDGSFLSGAAIQFLLGEGNLLESFRVTGGPCEGDAVRLHLVPVEDATYERLEIVAGRSSGLIQETAVHDLFGNVTRVVFRDVVTNQDPPPERFRFEPPAGVRVMEVPGAAP